MAVETRSSNADKQAAGAQKGKKVGRRVRRIQDRMQNKQLAQQRKLAEEAARDEKRKAEEAARLAENQRMFSATVEKKDAPERRAIADAAVIRAARQADVQRQEAFVAYLSRGRTPPTGEWHEHRQNSFRERHGRPPTDEELRLPPQLAEEQLQLRVSRHDLAEAALAVVEAKRQLLLKEHAATQKRVRQYEREKRKGGADMSKSKNVAGETRQQRVSPIYDELAASEYALRQNGRRRRAARDLELAWPGQHWRRNVLRLELPEDPEIKRQREEERQAEAVVRDLGWNL